MARHNSVVTVPHLALALIESEADSHVGQLLLRAGIKRDEARLYLEALLEGLPATDVAMPRVQDEIIKALSRAMTAGMERDFWSIFRIRDAVLDSLEYRDSQLLIVLAGQKTPTGEVLRALGLHPRPMRAQLRQIQRAAAPNGNPLKMLDADARAALHAAQSIARAGGCGRIATNHLLLGLLENREGFAASLREQSVNVDALAAAVRLTLTGDGVTAMPQIRLTNGAKRALERARNCAPSRRSDAIGPLEVWRGLMPQTPTWLERWRWREASDPLQVTWKNCDMESLQRATAALVEVATAERARDPLAAVGTLNALWILAGAAWSLWLITLGTDAGLWVALGGYFVAAFVKRVVNKERWPRVRVASESFLLGLTICGGLIYVVLLAFGV